MDTEYMIFMKNVVWLRKHHKLSKKKIENGVFPERLCVNVYFNMGRYFRIPIKDLLQKYLE